MSISIVILATSISTHLQAYIVYNNPYSVTDWQNFTKSHCYLTILTTFLQLHLCFNWNKNKVVYVNTNSTSVLVVRSCIAQRLDLCYCHIYFLPAISPRLLKGSQPNFPRRRQMCWNRIRGVKLLKSLRVRLVGWAGKISLFGGTGPHLRCVTKQPCKI